MRSACAISVFALYTCKLFSTYPVAPARKNNLYHHIDIILNTSCQQNNIVHLVCGVQITTNIDQKCMTSVDIGCKNIQKVGI